MNSTAEEREREKDIYISSVRERRERKTFHKTIENRVSFVPFVLS